VKYPHLVPYVVVGPNAIPSLIVLDFALQEVPPLIQDENGDVSEWAQKGSKCSCKVDACTSFYVAKWLFYQHLEQTHSLRMQAKKSRHPSICPWGPRQQDHSSMNVRILSNSHARQKWNEKKALD
jgi:hypothetical protein